MKVRPLPLISSTEVGLVVVVVEVVNWNEKVVWKEDGVWERGSKRRIGEEWRARPARCRRSTAVCGGESGGIWMQPFF